jgi:hypothetical protein
MSDHLIGRTKDGSRIYVQVELREHHHDTPRTTTDHREVTDYVELSVMGLEVPKYCRTAHSAGQIDMHIKASDFAETTLPRGMVRELWHLWERWHLNGMKAGCVHQDDVPHQIYDWRAAADQQTKRCPEGYRYGSAHLVETLPADVEQRIREIQAALSTQPQYTGN